MCSMQSGSGWRGPLGQKALGRGRRRTAQGSGSWAAGDSIVLHPQAAAAANLAPCCARAAPRCAQVSEDIVFMLSSNLFRALPPSQGHGQESYDMDEEEPNLDPAWPHLQVRGRRAAGRAAGWCCAAPAQRAGVGEQRRGLRPRGAAGAGAQGCFSLRVQGPAAPSKLCAPSPCSNSPAAPPAAHVLPPLPADCVRVPAAVRGVQRHRRQGGQALHRPELCGARAGPLRLGCGGRERAGGQGWAVEVAVGSTQCPTKESRARLSAAGRSGGGRARWLRCSSVHRHRPPARPCRGPAGARLPQDHPAPHLRWGRQCRAWSAGGAGARGSRLWGAGGSRLRS